MLPIEVTPAGITTAPAHEVPLDTTPEVIVKVPPPPQLSVVVACTGVEIKASSSAEMVAVRTEYLRFIFVLFICLSHIIYTNNKLLW